MVADLSPEAQKEVEKVVNNYPKAWGHGVCAFAMIDKKTGKHLDRGCVRGDVCHASISYDYGKQEYVVVNAHKGNWKDVNREFLKWVTQEGPFTHGVLNRDNEDELLNHASVIDKALVGSGGALWICKATRHFTEDTYKLKFWTQLREHGLDGFQSFIGADILNTVGAPAHGTTHTGLFGYNTPQKLREVYDEIRRAKKIDGGRAAREGKFNTPSWGSLQGKQIRKPDGWGGYVLKNEPCDAKEYAAKLKEIFEGDPKNVIK